MVVVLCCNVCFQEVVGMRCFWAIDRMLGYLKGTTELCLRKDGWPSRCAKSGTCCGLPRSDGTGFVEPTDIIKLFQPKILCFNMKDSSSSPVPSSPRYKGWWLSSRTVAFTSWKSPPSPMHAEICSLYWWMQISRWIRTFGFEPRTQKP